jgi:hypothetical protein
MENVRTQNHTSTEQDIEKLNSFLRGEISAFETYTQALEKLEAAGPLRTRLEQCRNSHGRRVTLLREEIVRRGGVPADGSGVWGAFAKLVEGGAKLFGAKSAIAALEEGEDHGRDDYLAEVGDVSADVRRLVESKLLPEQLRTHDTLAEIKQVM